MAGTFAVTKREQVGQRQRVEGTLTLTSNYATAGYAVDMTTLKLERLDDLRVWDPAVAGIEYRHKASTNKVQALVSPAHDVLVKGGQAAAGTAATAWYATDILGKEAVTDKTILGADSATKGGVLKAATATAEYPDATALSATLNFVAVGR